MRKDGGKATVNAQQKLIGKEQQGTKALWLSAEDGGDLRGQEERERLPMENNLPKIKSCNMYSVFLDQRLSCKEISSAEEVFPKDQHIQRAKGTGKYLRWHNSYI